MPTGFTNVIKVKVKEEKMLKVGRKGKKRKREREKAHKLDCLDLSSHLSPSC